MRWLAPVALLAFASGCLDAGSPFASEPQDCTSQQAIDIASSADVLLPASVPDPAREPFGIARVTVPARAGQTLAAASSWQALGGEASVRFDGPRDNEVEADNSWASTAVVETTGDYTLELEGAPMATGVTYTLYLVASGCTPAEA